jgi:alkylation response protein AidB-like acyl-CoA dehydrogenase
MIFTEDQNALQGAARRFSRERLLPMYQQREREGRVDRSLLREMGKLGLLGMDLPDRYGGMDVDAVTTGMIIEELAYGDFNIGALAVVQSLCGAVIERNAKFITHQFITHYCFRRGKKRQLLRKSLGTREIGLKASQESDTRSSDASCKEPRPCQRSLPLIQYR